MAEPSTIAFGKTGPQLAWFSILSNRLGLALHADKFLPTGFKQEIPVVNNGDVKRALEMYGGRFEFAGEVIDSTPHEVFNIRGAHKDWRDALITLGWLQDFRISRRYLHDQYALRLLHYWSLSNNIRLSIDQSVKVTCALATFGQQIAMRCENELQQNFLRIVSVHLRNLINQKHKSAEEALDKALAISYCLAGFQGLNHLQKHADRLIEHNLNQVILKDGGHRSRDILKLCEFAQLALPLRQVNSNSALSDAVTQSLSLLNLLEGPDRKLSAVVGSNENIAARFAFGDQQVETPSQVQQSGYARLEQDKSLLIADTSSALAIDFFVGTERVFHTRPLNTGQSLPSSLQTAPQGQVLSMQTSTTSRIVFLSANGDDLRVEDQFQNVALAEITLLLPLSIKLLSMQEGQAIMLIMPDNTVLHLKQRGGSIQFGNTTGHFEIIIRPSADNLKGCINWSIKKQLRPIKSHRNRRAQSELLI